jgi:TP901 family phage tail tape measure protein
LATTENLQIRIKADTNQAQQSLKKFKVSLEKATDVKGIKKATESINKSTESIKKSTESVKKNNESVKKTSTSLSSYASKMKGVADGFKNIGSGIASVGMNITNGITKPIIGIIGASVKTAADFENSMNKVRAISGATGKDFKDLENIAREMGRTTKFTAVESAEALTYMGMAGWKAKEMVKALPAVLDLAAAAGEDLARTSDIVTDAMTAFHMKASEAGKFADLLANTSRNANTNVAMMGQTFKYVAPIMATAGYSIEDTSLAIGLMANNGIKASSAGTALRAGVTNLLAPTKAAKDAIKKYNIEMTNSDGTMKSFQVVLDNLRSKFKKMSIVEQTAAANALFGKRAMSGWLAMINSTEADLVKVTKATRDYNGAAAEMADIMQEGLTGQVTKLKSAIEGLMIDLGNIFLPLFKKIVTIISYVINKFGAMNGTVKRIVIVFALLIAAIGPIISMIGLLVFAFASIAATVLAAIPGIIALGSAISTVAGIIASLGWPVILALIAGFVAWIAIMAATTAAIILVANKTINALMPVKDTFMLLKKVIQNDFVGAVDLLVSKFGMTKKAAFDLANRFAIVKDKASQLVKVISTNLGPIFSILGNKIKVAIDSLLGFSDSTDSSKKSAVNMFSGILKWAEKFVNYFYNIFDSFGLIPTEVKYANDKTSLEFIKLNSNVKNSLDNIIVTNKKFGGNMTADNKKAYDKLVADTKIALDNELKFVTNHLTKKQNKLKKAAEEMFKSSSALTEKEENESLKQLDEYNNKQLTRTKDNNDKILKIIETAQKEKRATTVYEDTEILRLQQELENTGLELISSSKLKQQAIREESANMAIQIKRDEGMQIITEANKAHDTIVAKALETKQKAIETAILMRDETGTISSEQAQKLIDEANRTYESTVTSSNLTKTETINNAIAKANGTISESEREAREIDTNTKKIEAVMSKVWGDIKEKIPGIVTELVGDIISALGEALIVGINNSFAAAGKAFTKGLEGLAKRKSTSTIDVMPKIDTKTTAPAATWKGTSITPPKISSKPYFSYANGTNYAEGGLSLVGEKGPELVNLKKGATVYTAGETRKMIPGFASGTKGTTTSKVSSSSSKAAKAEEARQKAAEKAAKATKSAIEKAAKAAQKQRDDVSKSVGNFIQGMQSQSESLLDFGNLFEKVVTKKMSGQKLLNNLKTQISYMNQWKSSLNSLGKRIGKTSDLYNNLLAQGPEAAAEIGALSKLGANQLNEYVNAFEQKRDISYEMGYQMESTKQSADLKQQQTVLNITGNTISDTLDIDIIANKIIQKLKVSGVY